MDDLPLGVLPGAGWVIERTHEDGTRSVMPLAGWLVQRDGELRPLPLSLGSDWIVRPRTQSDDDAIAATARRLRPSTTNTNWNWS